MHVRSHGPASSVVPSLNQDLEGKPPLTAAALAAMSTGSREAYFIDLKRERTGGKDLTKLLRRDMQLERAFVARGGLLMAGSDPVGLFGSVPGFADHREIELLVEAGFYPRASHSSRDSERCYLSRPSKLDRLDLNRQERRPCRRQRRSIRADRGHRKCSARVQGRRRLRPQ